MDFGLSVNYVNPTLDKSFTKFRMAELPNFPSEDVFEPNRAALGGWVERE